MISASEAPLLSRFGGFSRFRKCPSMQTTSHRPSSLLWCGPSSTTSQPCGLCRGGKPLPNPVLPAGFLDQVVARVTTEVTRQLQPLLSGAGTLQLDVPLQTEPTRPQRSATANQAPAPVQPTGSAIVPQDHTDIPVVGNPVSQVVTSFQSNLTGAQGLFPSLPQAQDPFTSINLPVDAIVAMNLKTKIWQQEYIVFGSLLVNPTLDGKFQLTIHNSNEGLSPSLALEPLNKPPKISSLRYGSRPFTCLWVFMPVARLLGS